MPTLDEKEEKLVVANPSHFTLDDSECSRLRKGLGFLPVEQPDPVRNLEDLNRFYRMVRLHAFFNNLDQTVDERNHGTDLPDDEFTNFKRQYGSSFTPK